MLLRLIIVCALVSRAHAQCDPFSSQEPIAIPSSLRLENTCGNGRVDTYATDCEHVKMGGCGHKFEDKNLCTKEREVCDGRALAGSTCKKLGFTGGKLSCGHDCMAYETKACTLCPAGSSCSEESTFEVSDLRLMVQGDHVRLYWLQEYKTLRVADVDLATGALVDRRVASPQPVVVTQVGSSAIGLGGVVGHPALLIAKASGAIEQKPLAESYALLPAYDQPFAVLYAETAKHERKLTVIDETGAERAPIALVASDANHKLLMQPLTPGSHHVVWESNEGDFIANQGDALVIVRDSMHSFWLGVLRDGAMIDPFDAKPRHAKQPSPDVVLDGQVALSITDVEIVAFGARHPLVQPKPKPMLGELAYRDPPAFVAVQTPAVEVHAAMIWDHLAVAVRKR